ncbi:MAG: STAS domain-containing protein [Chloroflexi bacterium]|nr:STAS domain-containing protein [Chloroflexota bacterium]
MPHETKKDITLVAPRGRLDAAGARPLDEELKTHIAAGRIHLIVDLKETRYVSSNGMRVLLAAHKRAQKFGGGLVLCCLTPRLIEIFEMAGFDRVFAVYASRAEAEHAQHE